MCLATVSSHTFRFPLINFPKNLKFLPDLYLYFVSHKPCSFLYPCLIFLAPCLQKALPLPSMNTHSYFEFLKH